MFTRSGLTWTQQGSKLTGGGESGKGAFGYGVGLSSDGNTALIGGPRDSGQRRRSVGVHALGVDVDPTGLEADRYGGASEFGLSVKLSAFGTTALIGSGGAAWVFTRSGSTWTQQGPQSHRQRRKR